MKLKLIVEQMLMEKARPGDHVEVNWGDRKQLKNAAKMTDAEVKGTFTLVGRPNFGAISVRSDLTKKLYRNLSDFMFNPAHIKNYLDQELHGTKFSRHEMGRSNF